MIKNFKPKEDIGYGSCELWSISMGGFIPDSESLAKYGLMGDYIGGVWGTVVSLVALIFIYRTWHATRRADTRNSVVSLLTEMLKTHDGIMQNNPDISRQVLREVAYVYKATLRLFPDLWSREERADISYTLGFYGPNTQAARDLSKYGPSNIRAVHDEVSRFRDRAQARYSGLFKGHQATLSHYMRNLFTMYTLIESSSLDEKEKKNLGKIVRTRLSNYDQALLALNIMSHLGQEWEQAGLLEKYKPFANVPQYFFGFDPTFSLKARFPSVQFEWERQEARRPRYRQLHISSYGLVFISR